MSLRARLLAGMVVVSFVLIAAAVIIARTTQANLVDRVDQQLSAAASFPPGVAAGGPTQFYGYTVSGGSFANENPPTVRTEIVSQPAVTVADAVHGARTGDPFTV